MEYKEAHIHTEERERREREGEREEERKSERTIGKKSNEIENSNRLIPCHGERPKRHR